MKIAKGSKSWIFAAFSGFLIFTILSFFPWQIVFQSISLLISVVFIFLMIFFLVFFRDPDRKTGNGFVAVADGKIREISKIKDKDLGDCIKISTFMNVYNVHVNRMPFDGVVKDIKHINGSYLPAFRKESEKNERTILLIESSIGMVKIIQIAGTLARRIVNYVKSGDKLKKGDKIGIIRLGSRVDVYIKSEKVKKLKIKEKSRVFAGESVIAEIND